MRPSRRFVLLTVLVFAGDLMAGSLEVIVKDDKGRPSPDAVAYVAAAGAASAAPKKHAVVDQRDKQFIPYVTAVQVGTPVIFPNSDNIRHHVYSFSPAKKFELPLYSGVPAEPVVFDKVGFVTLGCNIHDWMIAVRRRAANAVFSSDETRRTRRVERSAGRAIHRAGVAPGVERPAGSARPTG